MTSNEINKEIGKSTKSSHGIISKLKYFYETKLVPSICLSTDIEGKAKYVTIKEAERITKNRENYRYYIKNKAMINLAKKYGAKQLIMDTDGEIMGVRLDNTPLGQRYATKFKEKLNEVLE